MHSALNFSAARRRAGAGSPAPRALSPFAYGSPSRPRALISADGIMIIVITPIYWIIMTTDNFVDYEEE